MFPDIHKIFQERLAKSCWDGYKAIGTKEKDGKTVPNCVPVKEEEIPGGDASGKTLEDIAKKHKIDLEELKKEFDKGKEHEKEHTDNEKIASEITLDHLDDDPKYYSKLSKFDIEETVEGDYHCYEPIMEAEHKGKKVTLNKPMQGDSKKFKVYVKDGDKVKKVNFGDPNMRIKKSNPKRRKSFRARHKCATPGPKTKARYWSCKKWEESVEKVEEGFLSTVQDTLQGNAGNVSNQPSNVSQGPSQDPVNQLDSQKYEEYKKENDAITSKMSALNGQRDNLNKKINDLKRQQEELKKKYKLK